VWFVALEGLFRHKINVFTKLIKSPLKHDYQASKQQNEFRIYDCYKRFLKGRPPNL